MNIPVINIQLFASKIILLHMVESREETEERMCKRENESLSLSGISVISENRK